MITLLIALILAMPSVAAGAEPPDVTTMMRQLKEVFAPVRPSTRKAVISVSIEEDGKTEKAQWIAGQAFKKLPDGKWTLIVILAPQSWKGHAFLVHERENEPPIILRYLPALHHTVPVNADEYFLDTDFTYTDLGFGRLHGRYQLMGEEERAGVRAYKVKETITQEGAPYSQIITWVAIDSRLPLQRDYYDLAGKLWKSELFNEGSSDAHASTPLYITMRDLRGKSSTEFNLEQVRSDGDIPNEVFDPKRLGQVADSPLWQGYRPSVAQKE